MARLFLPLIRTLVLLVVSSVSLAAQQGSISGRVTDESTARGIEGARVAAVGVAGRANSAVTDETGSYRLGSLAPGRYTVVVNRLGHAEKRVAGVDVTEGGTTRLDIAMSSVAMALDMVVSTASRHEEKMLDAPATVSVVTQQEMATRPSLTVADHVKGLPGVDVSTGGIVQSNIVTRGFNNAFSTRLLTLRDYRFAAVPSLGVNVAFLVPGTLEDIERIEVVLGPAAALYGPNSADGVMHIVTRSPFDSPGSSVTLDGGSRSIVRGSARTAQILSEKVAVKLSGEAMKGDEWHYDDPGEPDQVPHGGGFEKRSFDVNRYTGEARLDFRPTDSMAFITTYGITRIGSAVELTAASGSAQVRNWTYNALQQRFTWKRLFAQVFVNTSNSGNEDSLDTEGTFLLRSGSPIVDHSTLIAASIQHGYDLGARQRFIYGADYSHTDPRTGGTINGRNENRDNVTEAGAYLHSVTQLHPKVDFVAALRVDDNNLLENQVFSPRAALVFKPSVSQNVRLTYNRAYSSPRNFENFLDLVQVRNPGGLPYTIRAVGNVPREGWQYSRTCASTYAGGLCMRSPFPSALGAPSALVDANAAAYYQTALAIITPSLPASVAGLLPILQALNPTGVQVAPQLRYITGTATVDPASLQDIAPLKPSFTNSFEAGYKGTLGRRTSVSFDVYHQQEINFSSAAQAATPNVFLDPASLGAYLAVNISAALQAQGMSQAQADATAAAAAPALAGALTRVPVGTVSFANGGYQSPDILYTYRTIEKTIRYSGADLGVDFMLSDRFTVGGSYSFVTEGNFPEIQSGGLPLRLNAPQNKGAVSLTYGDDARGATFQTRVRYNDGYEVNSGVYASGVVFPTPGVAGGTYTYPAVPTRTLLDAGITLRIPGSASRGSWSLNGTNVLNSYAPTFVGVPAIGRMILTRIQYNF